VWQPSLFHDTTRFTVGSQFVVAPNSTFTDASCANGKVTPPRLALPSHSAPIGAAFDKAGKNLYVSLHGSWDRSQGQGYKLIQIPFTTLGDGTYDPVARNDSGAAGFNDILSAQNVNSCQAQTLTQSNCHRLAAVTWDSSGSVLYVSSDNQAEGEIFALQPPK
jgi:glucose/arabinose dehydrogenase